ncbi:hypothetical protein [Brevibacillus daliensis]|uniref:hypothetical protein n=1 Tax=Brevibacillus daliensis TaxID=2892995 RepID=UPI001E442DB3|nr:hypothetical protein [Brevibacillus daliensis]
MVTLESTVSFLIYITAVSSAAAGVTEIAKSVVPFMGWDYEPADNSHEAITRANRKEQLKKAFNLLFSAIAAGFIFAQLKLDPALILMGQELAYVENAWSSQVWVWGIVAVFGSPMLHSLLKILQGYQEVVSNNAPPKPKRKISGK